MSKRRQPTEQVTLHFDLRMADTCSDFYVNTGLGKHSLKAHNSETRAFYRTQNKALAMMSDADLEKITHYAENVELPSDVARLIRVHFHLEDSPLPGLALVKIYVPKEAREHHLRQKIATMTVEEKYVDPILLEYGISHLPLEAALETSSAADDIATPKDAAVAVLFHHPSLASRDSDTASIILNDCIEPAPGLSAFASDISKQGVATKNSGWATIIPSVDGDDQPYTYDPDGEWTSSGDVYHYNLSDETVNSSNGQQALKSAVRIAAQNPQLQNTKWAVNPGTPDDSQTVDTAQSSLEKLAASLEDSGYSFTVNNKTPGHGLKVSESSLSYDNSTSEFKINAANNYLRTLSAYIEFQNDQGNALTPDGWTPVWDGIFDSPDSKQYFLSTVSAVNTVMGIPLPFLTDPTQLAFTWPVNASQASLKFGGMGTSHWNGDVDTVGFVATGVYQYGIPVLLLAVGAAIESSSWYKKFMEDKEMVFAVYSAGAFLVAGLDAGYSTIVGVKAALTTLASAIAGMLASKGLASLATWVFTKVTAAEAEDAIPFAGWAARVANMTITAAGLAETTVEVLSSPSTYTVEVKRLMVAQVTVHPDPTHGRTANDAIWPTEADHWVAIVQYKDGTNYKKSGPLPTGNDASQPVIVDFSNLPAGSQLQVKFGVYSSSDWLAGNWTSAWVDAVVPVNESMLKLEGSIQENLVPLTAKTQYHYKQKIAWDGSQRVWQEGNQPSDTIAALNQSNEGNNLGKLVNLTLNDKAYMLGYCWYASGQDVPLYGSTNNYSGQIYTFANLNTLADPSVAYKFSEAGFGSQPFIIYDQFGPAPLFNLPSDVEDDLNAGGTPSTAIQQAFTEANYTLTNAETGTTTAQITVVTESAEWHIGEPDQDPTYDIRRVTDELQVFDYPQPPYSPNNFYLQPVTVNDNGQQTVQYYLRQVVLDETTPFGVTEPNKKTFGIFTIPHMDAFAVHPAGYVIAVSYSQSKMQILKLGEAMDDADAPTALYLSGEGVRQGLMNGPKALTITADGRILVLEQDNQRIQAFDINGNPVHCFDGEQISGLSLAIADYAADLNNGFASQSLRDSFANAGATLSSTYTIKDGSAQYGLTYDADSQIFIVTQNGLDMSTQWTLDDTVNDVEYLVKLESDALSVWQDSQKLFDLESSDAVDLNQSAVTQTIITEFQTNGGITLPVASEVVVTGNEFQLQASLYQSDLALGIVSDALKSAFQTDRGITLSDSSTVTPTVTVTVKQTDQLWIVADTDSDISYKIFPADSSTLEVLYYNPTMDLHLPNSGTATYLDMANELKGYIYVLAHTGDGTQQSDYYMDIYAPTGEWLSRTPDKSIDTTSTPVNAAKLIVDQWRTMFTLNYEHYISDHGTEPSISEWVPSTPDS